MLHTVQQYDVFAKEPANLATQEVQGHPTWKRCGRLRHHSSTILVFHSQFKYLYADGLDSASSLFLQTCGAPLPDRSDLPRCDESSARRI